jgi:hypothetical protein
VTDRRFWLVAALVHLSLAALVPCRETLWLVSHSSTRLTSVHSSFLADFDQQISELTDEAFVSREVLLTYQHSAGIETGYGFFAPNLPDSYRVRFEGKTAEANEYKPVILRERHDPLRTSSLLDYLGRHASESVREFTFKLLAYSVWQRHPEVARIRVILETLHQPTLSEFRRGQSASFQQVSAYDFSLAHPITAPGGD